MQALQPMHLWCVQADAAEFGVIQGLGRTDLDAGRIGAVHAAVLSEQPFDVAAPVFNLLEADQRPGVPLQVRRILVTSEVIGLARPACSFHCLQAT